MTSCKQCTQKFFIRDEDRSFYEKMGVPDPTHCPDCRQQRRLAWRNEHTLYPGTCSLCKKQTVSLYPPDTTYTIYCQTCWWGDGWDAKSYGRDFDFSKPFFEQYKELQRIVPRLNLFNLKSENSEFTNHSANNKNCYIGCAVGECVDCMYGHWTERCRNCIDSLFCKECDSCYECSYCTNCYQTFYSQHCQNTRDVFFCFDCRDCDNMIGCTLQRHQQYMILNKKVTPEEFAKTKHEMFIDSDAFESMRKQYEELKLRTPRKFSNQVKCVNSTGDDLTSCKNSEHSFNCRNLEDCKYMFDLGDNKNSMDVYEHGWIVPSELVYESHAGMSGYNLRFTHLCSYGKDQTYTDMCVNDNSDLFGCISMKKSRHCILNKEYTKEEYEGLVSRIIEHMSQVGEWGEFFPIELSPYAYNETAVQEQYPITREQALQRGWKWQENLPLSKGQETMRPADMPFSSSDVDIVAYTKHIFVCKECSRNYRLLKQEIEFYKKYHLPLPKKCFNCRRIDRFAFRNKRHLYRWQCMNSGCENMFETTFAPERPEIVYCEECYQKEVV